MLNILCKASHRCCHVINRRQSRSPHCSKTLVLTQCSSSERQPNVATSTSFASGAATGLLAAAVALSATISPMISPPPAWSAQQGAVEEKVEKALNDYYELESKGKANNQKALDDLRSKYRIKRAVDGRVYLRNKAGEWLQVRLDMEVPGSILLRDPAGRVFAMQTNSIQQVDLSDDYILLLLFADGGWEDGMAAVEYQDEGGKPQQLKLSEKEFREVVGILKELEDQDDDEGDQ